jgi:glyoxylase-like metal-dependent hydrolase (beta-lactamase superfamily II)
MKIDSIQVGDITIAPVVDDGYTRFDALHLLPDATDENLAAEFSWMVPRFYDPASKCFKSVVQGFVFRAAGKNVLVDTCVGNDKAGRPRPEWTNAKFPFLENLLQAGFKPADIDVVLCTHLHVDHAGWNTRLENGRWVPTFANAEYLTNKVELEALEKRRDHGPAFYKNLYADSVLPILQSGQAVTVGIDHKLSAGVALEPSPGHTPGHVSVRVGTGADSAIVIGDMIHHPIQALHPHWNSRHCEIPELARRTRREFLERVADTAAWVLPGHFDPCRVKRHGDVFRFSFKE